MKLSEIAKHVGGRLVGDGQISIETVASLSEAGSADISFVREQRLAKEAGASKAGASKAGALIAPEDFAVPTKAALLLVPDVNEALEQVLSLLKPRPEIPEVGVHPSACVAPGARLGGKVSVGPHVVIADEAEIADGSVISAGCYIGAQARMGQNCFLGPNVVINARCVLGDNVIIHSNSTIGTDGFGYRLVEGKHRKIPHIGMVVIEDDVEIGANSCVDRAKFGKTVIGRGTKIDNLVHIAHNVQIGEHSIIAGQTGIAGSSRLGKYVVLGGQCGVNDHIHVGDGVMAGAQCGMLWDVEPGARITGTPYRPVKTYFREISLLKKLPEMVKEIKRLRKQVEDIGSSKDDS